MNFGRVSVGGVRETPGRWVARSLLLIVCVVPSSRRRIAASVVSVGKADTSALLAQREARKTRLNFMVSNKKRDGKIMDPEKSDIAKSTTERRPYLESLREGNGFPDCHKRLCTLSN